MTNAGIYELYDNNNNKCIHMLCHHTRLRHVQCKSTSYTMSAQGQLRSAIPLLAVTVLIISSHCQTCLSRGMQQCSDATLQVTCMQTAGQALFSCNPAACATLECTLAQSAWGYQSFAARDATTCNCTHSETKCNKLLSWKY